MDEGKQNNDPQVDYSNLQPPEPMGSKSYNTPSTTYFQNPAKLIPSGNTPLPQGQTQSPASTPPPASNQNPTSSQNIPQAMPEQQPEPGKQINMPNKPPQNYQSLEAPKPAWRSIALIAFLTILMILAIFVFISWRGWVKIGFMDDIWNKNPSPSPTASVSASPEATESASTNVNDLTRKSDLGQVKQALLEYYQENGSFPLAAEQIRTSDGKTTLANALIPTYLEKLPDDPSAPQKYYGYKSDGKSFELTCVLENTSDSEGVQIGNYYIYKLTVKGE